MGIHKRSAPKDKPNKTVRQDLLMKMKTFKQWLGEDTGPKIAVNKVNMKDEHGQDVKNDKGEPITFDVKEKMVSGQKKYVVKKQSDDPTEKEQEMDEETFNRSFGTGLKIVPK